MFLNLIFISSHIFLILFYVQTNIPETIRLKSYFCLVPYNIAFYNLWRNDDQLRSFNKL